MQNIMEELCCYSNFTKITIMENTLCFGLNLNQLLPSEINWLVL